MSAGAEVRTQYLVVCVEQLNHSAIAASRTEIFEFQGIYSLYKASTIQNFGKRYFCFFLIVG